MSKKQAGGIGDGAAVITVRESMAIPIALIAIGAGGGVGPIITVRGSTATTVGLIVIGGDGIAAGIGSILGLSWVPEEIPAPIFFGLGA